MHPYELRPLEAPGLQAGSPQQHAQHLDMDVEEAPAGPDLYTLPQEIEQIKEDMKESHAALESDQRLIESDQMEEGSFTVDRAGTGTKALERGAEGGPGGDKVLPEPGVWPEKGLACTLCKRLFSSLEHLREHEYRHTLSLLTLSLTPQPTQPLRFKQSLDQPALAESAPTRFFCPQCPASFTLKSNADRHEKTIHMKKKLMQCVYCLKHFRDRTDLHRHLSSVHSKEREHTCPCCNKAFSTQKNLATHVKVCFPAGADVSQGGDTDSMWWLIRGVS